MPRSRPGPIPATSKQWNYTYIRRLLEAGAPIPRLLIGNPDLGIKRRLSIDYSDRGNLPPRPSRLPTTGWIRRWLPCGSTSPTSKLSGSG